MVSSMSYLAFIVRRYWLWLTAFLWLLITASSLWPAELLPQVPGTDKTHHFIAYTALVFPVAFARPRQWLLVFLLLLAWGGVIELIQPYVNRWGEWLDLAANAAGACLGLLLAEVLRRLIK